MEPGTRVIIGVRIGMYPATPTYEAGSIVGRMPVMDIVKVTAGEQAHNMTIIEGHPRQKVRRLGGNRKTCTLTVKGILRGTGRMEPPEGILWKCLLFTVVSLHSEQ
jgi:hypothetical protein